MIKAWRTNHKYQQTNNKTDKHPIKTNRQTHSSFECEATKAIWTQKAVTGHSCPQHKNNFGQGNCLNRACSCFHGYIVGFLDWISSHKVKLLKWLVKPQLAPKMMFRKRSSCKRDLSYTFFRNAYVTQALCYKHKRTSSYKCMIAKTHITPSYNFSNVTTTFQPFSGKAEKTKLSTSGKIFKGKLIVKMFPLYMIRPDIRHFLKDVGALLPSMGTHATCSLIIWVLIGTATQTLTRLSAVHITSKHVA